MAARSRILTKHWDCEEPLPKTEPQTKAPSCVCESQISLTMIYSCLSCLFSRSIFMFCESFECADGGGLHVCGYVVCSLGVSGFLSSAAQPQLCSGLCKFHASVSAACDKCVLYRYIKTFTCEARCGSYLHSCLYVSLWNTIVKIKV